MDFLPINIRIADARILIVGGGRVATHKAAILCRFTSRVTVVARRVSDAIKSLPLHWVERDFDETDLHNTTLLFVCTDDHRLNSRIRALAKARAVLTSVCDDPAASDFTSPAVYRNGNLTISVASDAKDVKRSIRVRDRINSTIAHDCLQID